MCKSIVSPKRATRQSFNETPLAVREERIRQLKHLTPEGYNDLLRYLERFWVFLSGRAEAREALNDALLTALQSYNGKGELRAYITTCALHYASAIWKKHERRHDELLDDDEASLAQRKATAYHDPELIESIEEKLIARIVQIIDEMPDDTWAAKYLRQKTNARKLFALFCQSAEQGRDVGVDEFDLAQEPAWHFTRSIGKRHRYNPKKIRREIINNLMTELGESQNPIFYAQRAVRDATAQALRER